MNRFTVGETINLYEANYKRLLRLVPFVRESEGVTLLEIGELPEMKLEVVEHCRYTTVVALTCHLSSAQAWMTDPNMKIRLYHDAKVAEVIACQNHCRFEARYPYPNRKMFSRHEKRQVNVFLGEWLEHCLAKGCRYAFDTPLTNA